MLDDLAKMENAACIHSDVCIIGAGAAGVTVARALRDSGLDICLLESGGTDHEAAIQSLAKGDNIGYEYYPLEDSRLRFFGGTTAVWGGRVAELDPEDFEKKSFVSHSGWPFGKETLAPYYKQAKTLLELPVTEGNTHPDITLGFDVRSAKQWENPPLETGLWQFDEVFDRFTLPKCQDLVDAANIRILLHATATDFSFHEDGKTVRSVTIKNVQGKTATVEAKTFVLATGGLEVPRLLLASNGLHQKGVGNSHDLVGRYFMEHPHARGGRVLTNSPRQLFKLLPRFMRKDGIRYGTMLRPGAALQNERSILNSAFTLGIRKHPGEHQESYKRMYNSMRHKMSPNRFGRGMWKLTKRASVHIQDRLGVMLNERKLRKPGFGIYAIMRAEQAPNPDSRVTLTNEKDVLGVPRIALNWQLSDIDKHSVATLMQEFDATLRQLDVGSVEPSTWLHEAGKQWEIDPLVSNHAIGGYHHMGTTRMSDDPKQGVVDADCRVHETANLYIAGSSVFPTSGWANPTLTILALALRLADKIKSVN